MRSVQGMSSPPPPPPSSPPWPAHDTAAARVHRRDAERRRRDAERGPSPRTAISTAISLTCIVVVGAALGAIAYDLGDRDPFGGLIVFVRILFSEFLLMWFVLPVIAYALTHRLPPTEATVRSRVLAVVAFCLAVATLVIAELMNDPPPLF